MNSYLEVIAVVEGKTEQIFVEKVLAPYLGYKNIGIRATQVTKSGMKGGDVKFSRVRRDIGNHLKQRGDTLVTTFIDYYGTKEWPGLDQLNAGSGPELIAETMNSAARAEIIRSLPSCEAEKRYVPFVAVHEFEALLFSDAAILADGLGVSVEAVSTIIESCGAPENINNSPQTAPSKRIEGLNRGFKKTTTGITIAEKIGIERMRQCCPLFNSWLEELESIQAG
ncbi:DUF4276 family protein [Leucothrix sargassi]|nr:DUF4276 family protein [Leucothrix sargassi]